MTLKTRKPNGRPSHPCILIEGDEKAGKSWMAAEFTGNPRIGRSFWIDIAEGDGDLYGAVPGADYEIVEHDGTYLSIYGAIADVHAEAKRAHAAGEPPVMLIVDPIGPLWDLLGDWARNRAKDSRSNKKLLEDDENAEINVGPTYWNPATDRWRRCMTLLLTFPGVVLLLARGKEIAAIGPDGNPVRGRKDYRVEGHKSLCHDVTAWVRLTRGEHPRIVGGRSVKVDMRPEAYKPRPMPNFTLEWLLFDALGYDPANARVRDGMELKPGSDAPASEMASVLELAVESAETLAQLKAAYDRIRPALEGQDITQHESARLYTLVSARKAQMEAAEPAAQSNGKAPVEPVGAAA